MYIMKYCLLLRKHPLNKNSGILQKVGAIIATVAMVREN